MAFKIPDYVHALQPYKPGNQREATQLRANVKQIFSLASNENPLGASEKVLEAINLASKDVAHYPDPSAKELTELVADLYGKEPEQIIFGHGSESLIAHIVNAFADINTRVLTSMGTFAGIYVKTHKMGRKLNRVPLLNHGYDLNKLLDRIHENTSIIYISNPNNPTGTMITKSEWEDFYKQVPDNILIVLDEAYSTYAAEFDEYVNGMDYNLPNLIVLRTLSKTHGLAGLRVGLAVGPKELISTLYKVKLPFEPGIISQKAAVAALKDQDFLRETVRVNKISLQMMMNSFDKLAIKYVYPYANFIMTVFDNHHIAEEFVKLSLQHGVAIRHCKPFGIPEGVRISSGTEEQTEYSIRVFEEVVNELKVKFEKIDGNKVLTEVQQEIN